MQKTKKKSTNFINQPFDFILCAVIFILLALGIVMVLSASAPSALAETGKTYSYASKQLLAAILGIFGMFFFSKINYNVYKKMYKMAYVVSVLILLLVLIPNVGVEANGATRWIKIPIIGQFQPSELTKIGLIIFYAGYLSDHKDELKSFFKGFVKPFLFLVPPVGILFVVQNHLSVSLVIISVTATMMLMAGARVLHFAICGGVRFKPEFLDY